jgi:hypothetical protein
MQRSCSAHGMWPLFSRKRYQNQKSGPMVHGGQVERAFTAGAPNEQRLTDITKHPTAEGSSTSAR